MKRTMNLIKRSLTASGGLLLCTLGAYLSIQANIGLGPWETLNMGFSSSLRISYGMASILVSALIIVADLLMREKIGIGTILDALILGKGIDLLNEIKLIPQNDSLVIGIAMMALGMLIEAFGQTVYMGAALCCGPRDALLVAAGKRVRKIPFGIVAGALSAVVLFVGWRMGAPVGVGTILSSFGMGITMQTVFRITKFEPRNVAHEGILDTVRSLA